MNRSSLLLLAIVVFISHAVLAQPFQLPTANRAIFDAGAEDRYFVGTVGKPWTSGTFGSVRSNGQQMHEGIDIKSLQRDKKGESFDPVTASADGIVAYVNRRSALSTYGNYIVLRHKIEGIEIYTLYAHLREVRQGLQVGQQVKSGEVIAIMGRTAATREGISKERAHLHFEVDFLVNDHFASWHKKNAPGQRNDHGEWNGFNLTGLDPRKIFLDQKAQGSGFSLLKQIRSQPELCRVFVRDVNFPWIQRYPFLVRHNPIAEKQGIIGFEIALNFNGLPFDLVPRAASEVKGSGKYMLLSVNEAEQKRNPSCHLVAKQRGRWSLAKNGIRLLDLLTYSR
jgi:murein DD-endopeptidase MepM/ murein hydrolase activator NlpD